MSSSGHKLEGAVMSLLTWILLAQIGSSTAGLPLSSFVRFGELLDSNDIHGSESWFQHLNVSFRFYTLDYTAIRVNKNGWLLIDVDSEVIPWLVSMTNIRIYHSGVDLTLGGDVWYRQTRDPEDLHQITSDIRSATGYAFTATWAFICTWENVTFTGAYSTGSQPRNTFQQVLAFDESTNISYSIMNYHALEWSRYRNEYSYIWREAGVYFEGTYDSTDHTFSLPGSLTENVTQLAVTSNVDVPGKWIYEISGFVPDLVRICPAGWLFDEKSYKCLKWFNELITKDEMIPKCEEHGATPLNIQKRGTNFFLKQISRGHIWLDIYKLWGTWIWGTVPHEMRWTNWSNRERQVGECVLMEARYSRRWRVVNCNNWRASYICSMPPLNIAK